MAFFLVYLRTATIIGWLDYKKFAGPVDATISAQANPWVQDLAKALMLISDGMNEEAKEVLRKWVET